jgi:Transposase
VFSAAGEEVGELVMGDGVDAPRRHLVCQGDGVELSLKEASVEQTITIGLDIAKHVFQAHGADAAGHALFRKRLTRAKLLGFLATQAPVVAMEACAGSHYWGREIGKLGHTVRLIPPAYVKPFVKRQKNDAADAEAICEAAQRPSMRFMPVKDEAQQANGVVFRARDLLVRQRTQCINALRGHLSEYGYVFREAMLVDGTPEPMLFPGEADDHLIQVPFVATARRSLTDAVGEFSPEFEAPSPDRLVGYRDAAGGQHLLDHAQAQRKPKIQPYRVADDLGGVAMAGVNRVSKPRHPARLPDQPGPDQACSRPT